MVVGYSPSSGDMGMREGVVQEKAQVRMQLESMVEGLQLLYWVYWTF